MTKRFILIAACALPLITPVFAENEQADVAKLRVDHERLIDLVLTLEADFGETLRDYAKLQDDLANALKRPAVPDQSGKVKELQKQALDVPILLMARKDFDAKWATNSTDLKVTQAKLLEAEKVAATAKVLKKKNAELLEKYQRLDGDFETLTGMIAGMEAELTKTREEMMIAIKEGMQVKELEAQLVLLKRRMVQIDPVRYDKGDADVNDQQVHVLNQVQGVLKLSPSARFEIVGHTCDLGRKEGNLRLSRERAKALHDFLMQKGVPPDLIKSRGVADLEPAAPNTNEENRRKNRRVEIEILDY